MPEQRTSRKSSKVSSTESSKKMSRKAVKEPSEPVCPVVLCPVGMALTAVQQARPDALEHLLAAARELLLAARVVIDVRAAGSGGVSGTSLERIEIA